LSDQNAKRRTKASSLRVPHAECLPAAGDWIRIQVKERNEIFKTLLKQKLLGFILVFLFFVTSEYEQTSTTICSF